MATTSKQYKAIGEDLWKGRTEKIVSLISLNIRLDPDAFIAQNAELFALTYGALVVQLIQDYEDYAEVNKQLEKMGYNIGTRLIEDFLARSSLGRCSDFREVGEVVAKVRTAIGSRRYHTSFMPTIHLHAASAPVNSICLPGRIQVVPQHHAQCNTRCATTGLFSDPNKHATTTNKRPRRKFYIDIRRESPCRVRRATGRSP